MKSNLKYIYKSGDKFKVIFTFEEKGPGYVGTYDNLEEAILERNRVAKENNINITPKGIHPLQRQEGLKYQAEVTLRKSSGKYQTVHLGIFETEEEAYNYRKSIIDNLALQHENRTYDLYEQKSLENTHEL